MVSSRAITLATECKPEDGLLLVSTQFLERTRPMDRNQGKLGSD